jgi:AFG3 family protein
MAEKNPKNKPEKQKMPNILAFRGYWLYMLIAIVLLIFYFSADYSVQETNWQEFSETIYTEGDVDHLEVINNERVEVYIIKDSLTKKQHAKHFNKQAPGPHYYFNIGSADVFHEQMESIHQENPHLEKVPIKYAKRENWLRNVLSWLIPIAIIILIWRFMMNRTLGNQRGAMNQAYTFGRSKVRVSKKKGETGVTFDDVAGLEEAKEEIYELVRFLKNPEKFTRLGAKMPKGVLLAGPPGTGKTLLAKAVAGEADVPFLSLTGSEFVEMFVGVGAARMRDLFQKAKEMAPSIIFIDEIDTIGRARGKAQAFQSNEEREGTLNQLLAELDGFDTGTGVIVLAATNREDILDPALLRPGRFDRHIHLDLPSLTEREAIFKVHMKPLVLKGDIDAHYLAAQTPGFAGADIANICNEAALIAAREEKDSIERVDFMGAIDRVVGGLEKRSKIILPEEKRRIAIHEAGHVVSSWYLKHAYPVLKVSIIPRGRSLGSAWYLPEENQIHTKVELLHHMSTALGGRAAEELIYEDVSSNAIDDLEKVTKQAYSIIMYYGMSDHLKNISYFDSSGNNSNAFQKPYSEKTAEVIDEEVRNVVNEAYQKTKEILTEHKSKLVELANRLEEKEVIYKEELIELLGAKPE